MVSKDNIMSDDKNECRLNDAAWESLQLIQGWIHQAFYIGESVLSPSPCLSWLCTDFRSSVSGSPAEEGSSDENRTRSPLIFPAIYLSPGMSLVCVPILLVLRHAILLN